MEYRSKQLQEAYIAGLEENRVKLRDEFAMRAMQAIMSDPEAFFGRDDYHVKIAEFSYKQADSMLEARKK